jgi:hypothetical protein
MKRTVVLLLCMAFCVETLSAQTVVNRLKTGLTQSRNENIAEQKYARESFLTTKFH